MAVPSASLNYLVTHVFFPFLLPDEGDNTLQNRLSLICAVSTAARSYSTLLSGSLRPHWSRIINMIDNLQASVQSGRLETDRIITQLRGMQVGDILTFFIQRQNAAVIITRREDTTLCESFQVSPGRDAVLGSEGPLVCSYPRSAIEICNRMFDDMELQYELASFFSIPDAADSDLPSPSPGDPRYVTTLLAGILRSVGRTVDVCRIIKRVRDDAPGTFELKPQWRRSPLWLLVRVIIQMSLERSLGHSLGHSSYKEFLLYFISTLAMDPNCETLDNDLLHLMECKILRRLRKLGPSTPPWLSEMALKTCTRLRQVLDARWEQPSISSPFRNPSQDELARDNQISSLNSGEYIRNALSNPGYMSVSAPFHPSHHHRGTINDFLSSHGAFFEEAYQADPDVTLYDVERSVEQGIDDWLARVTDPGEACAQLEILMDRYKEAIGTGSFREPEDSSIKLLTEIELFLALDKLVVGEIPLLAQYSPEIPITFLEKLSLHTTTSLHRLSRAYQYLSARHSSSHPGWSALSDEFTENSFPIRYYDQSPHLQCLKARIEDDVIYVITGHSSQREDRSLPHPYGGYHCQDVVEGKAIPQSPPSTSQLQAKVIVFELQCPAYYRSWRSAISRVFSGFKSTSFSSIKYLHDDWASPEELQENLLSQSPGLQPYLTGNNGPYLAHQVQLSCIYPKGLQSLDNPAVKLRYAVQEHHKCHIWVPISAQARLERVPELGSSTVETYVSYTLSPNKVLTSQAYCPTDLSLGEFTAIAHLRSCGSLRWLNILHGLRSRTLNLRRQQVYHILAYAAFHVGPFDVETGTWIWHQELQNPFFCSALMDELGALFVDFEAESIDVVLMGSISLLLVRVLASSPSEDVSERAVDLLRHVRKKTFIWVEELSYNLAMAPTSLERSSLLLDMAATCRSTFDVDTNTLLRSFHSSVDVDATLSCAFFIHSLRHGPGPKSRELKPYSERLLQRDKHLSFVLEEVLSDVILADPSEYGIDLAVRKILGRYQPRANRWRRLPYPNDRWFNCQTEVTMEQHLHLNLFDGSLRVNGQPSAGLPLAIRVAPECQEIFREQGFVVLPSDLQGMDFMTHTISSKRKVHYSLRDDILVLRVQVGGNILELIPSYIFWKDLPLSLVDGHIHWLNLSTRTIEIRPLEHLWEESSMNWRIDCAHEGRYRIYKGCETLIDIRSPTWAMISRCFKPLNDLNGLQGKSRNLLVTTSSTNSHKSLPALRLSVGLPHYGLSFFVNIRGELESSDFKDMVYDENQYAGTLFGLENFLVLRSKLDISNTLVPEALIHRRILIPDGVPISYGAHKVRIELNSLASSELFCHIYNVDPELGCLAGNGSLTSTEHLALLHAATSSDRRDPLTSKTGTQAALGLLRLAGLRSIMKLKALDDTAKMQGCTNHCPHIDVAHQEILDKSYWKRPDGKFRSDDFHLMRADQRAAHLFPPNTIGPNSREDYDHLITSRSDLELQDVAFTAASTIYRWFMDSPTLTPMLNWKELWDGDNMLVDTAAPLKISFTLDDSERGQHFSPSDLKTQSDPDLVRKLTIRVRDVLKRSEDSEPRSRFHLMFLLPTTAYCSGPCRSAAFLSMLVAFGKLPELRLGDLPEYAECNFLDGWRPTGNVVSSYKWSLRGDQTGFLDNWPHDEKTRFDLPDLDNDVRQLFSSCHRNFVLKEHLLRIMADPRLPILVLCPPAVSAVSESLPGTARTPECAQRPGWQITFKQLLSDRSVPELPSRSILLCGTLSYQCSKLMAQDTSTLALESQIFSLCPNLSFQQEYLTHLHASAQHVLEEPSMTYGSLEVAGQDRIEILRKHYLQCRDAYTRALATLRQALSPTTDPLERALDASGLWPQIGAIDFLQCLASTSPITIPPSTGWKKCLISFSLLLLDLQRSRRLLRSALYGLEDELSQELKNEPCDGWSPEEYPDWLLIQIEGNFLIRRAQAEAAFEIMSPQSRQNTVMQVNLGEGKSSVIIPIAAAALADGKQLVRVVVPQALTAQMFDLLVFRLGGLVNRPILHLPFSRNPGHDDLFFKTTLQVQSLMSQCMAMHGVLLLQPEHAVSLKLMNVEQQIGKEDLFAHRSLDNQKWIYNHLVTRLSLKSLVEDSFVGNIFKWSSQSPSQLNKMSIARVNEANNDASKQMKLQKWIETHSRDILDESDEILHARFQLIYTVGPQQHMDGYPQRWTITQQVLQLVKKHAHTLSRYTPKSLKYEGGPHASFPYIHIMRASDVGCNLVSFIAQDVMAGRLPGLNFQHVSPPLYEAIHSFISEEVLPLADIAERVEEYAKSSRQSYLWDGLLLLRGLLASNILVFALSEWRWRVNYGLRVPGPSGHSQHSTMLAVPYRAKDMPAPNTQFGHPDVTIILTCLSYYYTGLNEDQLRISFEILLDEDNPSGEYARWVKDYDDSLPESLRKLGEINLRSSEQWDKVTFPLFTRNQAAIDFYLSRAVFPQEAMEFPWKLSGSSWDLAEKRDKLITGKGPPAELLAPVGKLQLTYLPGLSGTDDNRWLLPTSIAQHDLEHQKGTNARILGYLLQPENDDYKVMHESGGRQSTREFLEMVANQQHEIRVLLDVGAQIFGLSNEEVVRTWLDVARDVSGAIYFDQNNELMVLTQEGTALPMLSSPLSHSLERCVVYLDHAHTRGTDLKLPSGFRAAVTLGPKTTKDSLVQGCMRMRKLGHGHSVMFFAPPDVDRSLRAVVGKQDPAIRVTTIDILCWAIHETWLDIQRWAPHWAQQGMNHKSRHEAWTRFSNSPGDLTREALSKAWLQLEHKSLTELYGPSKTEDPSNTLSALDPGIRQRCKALGVLSLPSARLEEEQEREVNREQEREREVELPPAAESAEHSLHPDVETFVKTGIIPPLHTGSAFQPVFTSLKKSTAATRDADVWSPFILATTDFCQTIKPESTQGTLDQYLRPVQWVLSSNRAEHRTLVLLSPFEVDRLLPDIRESDCVHLHLYAPRTSQRMKPSDDLKLYTIPPLPASWTPPWDLIDQLNVFSGQLYLRDYQSYLRLCRFLGVPTEEASNDTSTVRWNLFNIPGSFEESEIRFSGSPLPSVMALLGIRSRGRPFAHTHMGKILQGQVLRERDFEGLTAT